LLWGDNTDIQGFLANLDEATPGWRSEVKSALVLGAGGAARAIVHALLGTGVERVTLVNRTSERAARLSGALGTSVSVAPWDKLTVRMREADLFVNTTSLGMAGQPALEIDLANLPREAIVTDIVYIPLTTPLLDQAGRRGLRTVGGLGMLLHQAAPGFERWFGVRPTVSPQLRALVGADILAPATARS
jgi:shikimate dehydrogenase